MSTVQIRHSNERLSQRLLLHLQRDKALREGHVIVDWLEHTGRVDAALAERARQVLRGELVGEEGEAVMRQVLEAKP